MLAEIIILVLDIISDQ